MSEQPSERSPYIDKYSFLSDDELLEQGLAQRGQVHSRAVLYELEATTRLLSTNPHEDPELWQKRYDVQQQLSQLVHEEMTNLKSALDAEREAIRTAHPELFERLRKLAEGNERLEY